MERYCWKLGHALGHHLGKVIRFGFAGFAVAAAFAANGAEPKNAFVIGERFKIESKALNETRRYFVHTPDGYRLRSDRYPVVIVLDADSEFTHTSAAVDYLAKNGRIPDMIVVGITNTQRERDMRIWPAGAPEKTRLGTADRFLTFIADELLPTIDRNYRTHPYRVLIGHSLGGAYAVYALQTRPEVFNAYLGISPSLWQANELLVKNLGPFLSSHATLRADLYMTYEKGTDEAQAVDLVSRVSGILAEKAPAGLRSKFVLHRDETHNSIPYRSTYEGLQQLFDGWYLPDAMKIYDQSGLAGIEAHYAKVSQRMGYTVPVASSTAEELFGNLMARGRISDTEALVQKGFTWYPGDMVVHQAAVMVYSAAKDEARAIEHAKIMLARIPGSAFAREVLEDYKVDVSKLVVERQISVDALMPFAGSYANKDVSMDVLLKSQTLYSVTDKGEFELKALSDSSFYLANAEAKVTFLTNKRGKVTGVAIDQLGTTRYATDTLNKVQ